MRKIIIIAAIAVILLAFVIIKNSDTIQLFWVIIASSVRNVAEHGGVVPAAATSESVERSYEKLYAPWAAITGPRDPRTEQMIVNAQEGLDVTMCYTLSSELSVNRCYYEAALLRQDKSMCRETNSTLDIFDPSLCRTTIDSVSKKDPSLCETLDKNMRELCYLDAARLLNDSSLCVKTNIARCSWNMAVLQANPALCQDAPFTEACRAIATRDWAKCSVIIDALAKEKCYYTLGMLLKDVQACGFIQNEIAMTVCIYNVDFCNRTDCMFLALRYT